MSAKRRFILIGHPVAHSVSPAIHRAAYAALSIEDCEYFAVDCNDEEAVRRRVAAVRDGTLAGANVTIPWKRLALSLADDVDPLALDTGAANVLVCRQRRVVAHNTDVCALAAELSAAGAAPQTAAVLGNGGAALASVVACRSIGAVRVYVTARSWRSDRPIADWPSVQQFSRLGAIAVPWDASPGSDWHRAASESQIIVQATSAGMRGVAGGDSVVQQIPWPELRQNVLIYDVVYNPPMTPLLSAAQRLRVRCSGGLGMLVRQAAFAIELWLERSPPLDEMRSAAERALFGRP